MAFLRGRVFDPLASLLQRGLTPKKLAQSLATGAVLGNFPVLGTTTALCVLAGAVFKLNHVAVQLANWLMYPTQLPLIYVFMRLGGRLTGVEPGLSASGALWGAVNAAAGWAVVAPFLWTAVYWLSRLALRRAPIPAPLEA